MTVVSMAAVSITAGESRADLGGKPARVHAIVGATIVSSPGAEPVQGTIVMRDGEITSFGPGIDVPADARVHDRTGCTIYAGFIEPYLRLPASATHGATRPSARHENELVRPDVRAVDHLAGADSLFDAMRSAGYTTALVVPGAGLFRGDGTVAGLAAAHREAHVLVEDGPMAFAFAKAPEDADAYPSVLMGSFALTRQTLLDAAWYREAWEAWRRKPVPTPPDVNLSLEALAPVLDGRRQLFVEVEDLRMLERAAGLFGEHPRVRPVFVSGGCDEYKNLERARAWVAKGEGLVLALNAPPSPRWLHDEQRAEVELRDLRHWDAAPSNPARVAAAGIPFAFTTQGLKVRTELLARLRDAVARGLPRDVALAALTVEPARLLGILDRTGTIARGKRANLTISSGDLLDPASRIVEVWIDGEWHGEHEDRAARKDYKGTWSLAIGEVAARVSFDLDKGALVGRVVPPPGEAAGPEEPKDEGVPLEDVSFERGRVAFTIPARSAGNDEPLRVHGELALGFFRGSTDPATNGRAVVGRKMTDIAQPLDSTFVSRGAPAWPPLAPDAPKRVFVRDATVWTCGPDGTIANGDLLVADGRVVAVGRDLEPPADAFVIDGRGRHVTPGLIDCHSHSAVASSVNEGTQSATCEVRIRDILDPWSIALYRELAGGLTVSNVLHGSANVIGGQNAVIKLRYGDTCEGLIFAEAPAGVKFALGENVKQSNWGEKYQTRYPQTRMGVEQFVRDRFLAAREYRARKEEWARRHDGLPPKPDLELEALVEMLEGRRLIHCHAYRQDEMVRLMNVLEEFDVHVATFQHVLEGYKIADELARHGAGASSFADWWAFKFEVYDAIPYSGAILWERGVLTSYSSDSRDHARRLNLEAAKAVKYGGVPEEEALKFVTLNPAKQLRIDRWVGSIERGKHADFVLWSDHPFSDDAICLSTWIDGVERFSRARDEEARGAMEKLRASLLAKAEAVNAAVEAPPEFAPTFGALVQHEEAHDERGDCGASEVIR